MPSQVDIIAIIDRYTQLNQEVNRAQNQQNIQNFSALLAAATHYHLETVLKELAKLTTLEDKELNRTFDNLLKTQWQITQGTALDIFNNPDNVANSCLKEVAKIIYPNLTDEQLLLKFAPGIKQFTTATLINPRRGQLDFELKTEAITPNALQDLPLSDRIVAGDTMLSASSIISSFARLDFVKKVRADLEQNHPDLYAELLQKRSDIAQVFDILKQYKPTPREAITRLMEALKYSGSRFSGQALAGSLAGRAVAHFREYMDSLLSPVKERVYALNGGGGSRTLKQIVEDDLWKKGDCVETGAANLGKILESAANTSVLDIKPPQPTEDAIKKAFAEVRKPFSGGYSYPLESSVKIPPGIADALLSKINIQNEMYLIEFLRNLDIEYFAKLPTKQINDFINDAEKFQYVLIHLDFLKQKSFCQYAAANLKIFSSEKCIDILKKATPDQGALMLSVLKDKPIDLLNRWEYRCMLFTEERASHYLQALGPNYFKSAIQSVSDFWEWEKHLPSLDAVNVFLKTLSIDHIKGLARTPEEWVFVYERLTPDYQKQLVDKTDEAMLSNPAVSGKIASVKRSLSSPATFKPVIIKETLSEQLEIQRFLQHVILGEQDQAKAMVKAKPELLLQKAEVTDYSGRKFEQTAYQLALGAEDVDMAEMLVPYFKKLKDGQTEKEKQEQGQADEPGDKQRETADKKALNDVIAAIDASNTDAECEPALQKFRDYLKPSDEPIKTGKHFNIQLLIEAFKLYGDEKKYNERGGDFSRKNNLFWQKVIGFTQRYLPTCYAQAFCQGPYAIVNDKEPLRRSLEFRNDRGCFFFPLSTSSGLGYEYAGSSCIRAVGCNRVWLGLRAVGVALAVGKLCGAKSAALQKLMQRPDNQSKKGCSIM